MLLNSYLEKVRQRALHLNRTLLPQSLSLPGRGCDCDWRQKFTADSSDEASDHHLGAHVRPSFQSMQRSALGVDAERTAAEIAFDVALDPRAPCHSIDDGFRLACSMRPRACRRPGLGFSRLHGRELISSPRSRPR